MGYAFLLPFMRFVMDFSQFALYAKYSSIFVIGVVTGRLSMAIQYALMKPGHK